MRAGEGAAGARGAAYGGDIHLSGVLAKCAGIESARQRRGPGGGAVFCELMDGLLFSRRERLRVEWVGSVLLNECMPLAVRPSGSH